MYDRLQKVGVTISHSVTMRWLGKLSETYDSDVIEWRDHLIDNLDDLVENVSHPC